MYLLGEALIQPKRTFRSKSLLSEEHSHQNALLKLRFAAGYTLLVVHSLNDGTAVVSLLLLEPGDQEAQP